CMLRKTILIGSLIWVVALFGCSRKSQIESKLKQLNAQKGVSQQRLDMVEQKISSLQAQLNNLTNAYNANRNETLELMRNNPGKVVCGASGAVALSKGNIFSDEFKQLAAKFGLGCIGAYFIFPNFQKEVDAFIEEINNSSQRAKGLQAQLDSLRPKIDEETQT